MTLPTAADVAAAAAALEGRIERTPLVHAPALGVWIKEELRQRGGSFKLRGALNKLATLSPEQRAAGVTTVSAGNHARALALACREAGVALTVFMWRGASEFKIAAAREQGATVDLSSDDAAGAFAAMAAFVARTGATVVHPFDDPAIVAGAGTLGREIVEDLPEVRCVVVPIGGGGLISGTAIAVKAHDPSVRVVAVEPVRAATLTAALGAGAPVAIELPGTLADALAPPSIGVLNFAVCRDLVDEVVLLTEDDLIAGVRVAHEQLGLVCEPGGAAAVGAVAVGAVQPCEGTVLVASGGNIAPDSHRALLTPTG